MATAAATAPRRATRLTIDVVYMVIRLLASCSGTDILPAPGVVLMSALIGLLWTRAIHSQTRRNGRGGFTPRARSLDLVLHPSSLGHLCDEGDTWPAAG